MDIISGLSAAKIAIDIAKDLRSIDRSLDEATYKLKLADLSSALADTQIALSDAKLRVMELEGELDKLKYGELCPKCRTGKLLMVKQEPVSNYTLSKFGVEEWTYECNANDCDFSTKHLNDPQSLVPKFLGK